MIGVSVLGATGSIGTSTLDVLERHADRFKVVALSANRSVAAMELLCRKHRPEYVVMADAASAEELGRRLREQGIGCIVLQGDEGLCQIAALPQVDYVMAAIVGAAGLNPCLSAVRAGKRVLLANKEALVMAGRLFMDEVRASGAELLPIDSEHNAVFQCMPPNYGAGLAEVGVEQVLLTASGGPFRATPLEALASVTPEQACAHPNWSMGRKISVDSATMMNKGLEVIEAHWLFAAPPEKIQVVIHPQSIIHSMVAYSDGSVLAQMGNPDMRTPIAHALAWPERLESGVAALDLFAVGQLDFEAPDLARFPCLRLAYAALEAGGTAPCVLNAANEVAVEAFLAQRIEFLQIPKLIEHTLERVPNADARSIERILEADAMARDCAREWLAPFGV